MLAAAFMGNPSEGPLARSSCKCTHASSLNGGGWGEETLPSRMKHVCACS